MREPFRAAGYANGKPGLLLNSLREGQRVRTIRGTLIWMVVICVLPAWIGFAVLIQSMYSSERERAAQNTIMTARALMLAVDRELAATRAAVEVLATCPEQASDHLAAFHNRASALVRQLSGNNIVLVEQSGQQLLNTLVPFGGRPLPHGSQRDRMALDRLMFSTGTGTGLGLSIVKQIVQRLAGEVGFADAPGEGTVFFVELPRLQGVDAGNDRDADGLTPPEGDTGSAGHFARPPVDPSVPEFAKARHA
jgi:hypothetical protein